jgi:hypothetical protein
LDLVTIGAFRVVNPHDRFRPGKARFMRWRKHRLAKSRKTREVNSAAR